MAAKMAMIATTIIISMRVKPDVFCMTHLDAIAGVGGPLGEWIW
jgi:hypothetical protein